MSIDLPQVPKDEEDLILSPLFRGLVLARSWSTESGDTTWWIIDPAPRKVVWQTTGRDVRAVAITPAGEIYAARSRGVCVEERRKE